MSTAAVQLLRRLGGVEVPPTPAPTLTGLGFATPPSFEQSELARRMAEAWRLTDRQRERWNRIVDQSGITRRHAVADLAEVLPMTTAERMQVFEREAPNLAARAASEACDRAALAPESVTDVIVVTCTGFAAPGIGHGLIRSIGLPPTVRQTQIGFMGCFGGIVGLRTAVGLASADPQARVLVLCVELCSLHLRMDTAPDQLVAAALFADGAAAAIVEGHGAAAERGAPLGRLTLGRTRVLVDARDQMTWRIRDDGFAMTLTRDVPVAIEESIGRFIAEGAPKGIAPHPGGPGILDAIERGTVAMPLDPRSFVAARSVLRDYGNMSSGTVLFTAERYLASGGALPVELVAFGPGLTIDAVRLGP